MAYATPENIHPYSLTPSFNSTPPLSEQLGSAGSAADAKDRAVALASLTPWIKHWPAEGSWVQFL